MATEKHHYSGPAPSNLKPERLGTPRNVASPPPDVAPERFSQPPGGAYPSGSTANSPPTTASRAGRASQSASPQAQGAQGGRVAPTQYQPQPTRAGRHDTTMNNAKQGMGPDMTPDGGGGRKPPAGPEKPTGTVVPERRGMKEAGTTPGESENHFSLFNPSLTPSSGRGQDPGFTRSGHDSSMNRGRRRP